MFLGWANISFLHLNVFTESSAFSMLLACPLCVNFYWRGVRTSSQNGSSLNWTNKNWKEMFFKIWFPGPILSISWNVRIFVCPSNFLFTPFKHLFAPYFQSPMSKNFRFSESLGINMSQIWNLLPIKGEKFACNIFFFCQIFALLVGLFGIGATICIDREILCLPYASFWHIYFF